MKVNVYIDGFNLYYGAVKGLSGQSNPGTVRNQRGSIRFERSNPQKRIIEN